VIASFLCKTIPSLKICGNFNIAEAVEHPIKISKKRTDFLKNQG
jgi:hypothetical protein